MTTGLAEVSEAEAQGKVKTTYDDIKATLRTPVVSQLWRILATEPDFLLPAWTALKPNVQTVYFERRADLIRQAAVGSVATWGAAPRAPEEAAGAINVFHYLNPKLLLVTAALRAAAYGQQPRLIELPREEKRQLPSGVPADAVPVDLESPGGGVPGAAEAIEAGQEALGLTAPPGELRALARWPEFLTAAWTQAGSNVRTSLSTPAARQLRMLAEETVGALPYRMDISPHVLRHSGISESRLDAIQRQLSAFHRAMPGLVLFAAFLAGQGAGQSPFPLDL